jgi:hypothetical protein
MVTVASSARSVNDMHYALLCHPPSIPLVLMMSRVDAILLVVGKLHMTSRFSLLAPYPTERLDVILHQKPSCTTSRANPSASSHNKAYMIDLAVFTRQNSAQQIITKLWILLCNVTATSGWQLLPLTLRDSYPVIHELNSYCEIWCSHASVAEDSGFLRSDVMLLGIIWGVSRQ